MIFRTLCLLLICFPAFAGEAEINAAWYSVVPPLIAIVLAFISKRIFLSLGIATLAGSILAVYSTENAVNVIGGFTGFFNIIFNNLTAPWNLKVISFVLCILAMISIIIVSGGLNAIVQKASFWANNRQRSQLMSYFAGLLVFIDDYANTMIVGSSMRPISDQYRVSREKLAFIIDATSAPVAGLAIISTWIGYEVGLFADSANALAIDRDGYAIFLDALTFRFYCILMLGLVLISILREREFGKMYHAEIRALNTGELSEANAQAPSTTAYSLVSVDEKSQSAIKNALIPFGVLFLVLFAGFWLDGGGMQQLNASIFNIINPIIWFDVLRNTQNSSTILLSSAVAGLVAAILSSRLAANTPQATINKAILSGLKSSLLPISILILAWSLKTVCNDLNTGEYLVATLTPHLSPLLFPVLIFFIAALTAFGTGTSWGTMAILIPIAFPLAYALDNNSYGLITIICMAAVLDGAIFGDHCSPISDTTIMSSIASHCDHIHHVQTQLPYAILAGGIAMLAGYLPAAFGLSPWISYLLGLGAIYYFFTLFGKPVSGSIPRHDRNRRNTILR